MAFASIGNDTTNWPNMPPTFQQGEIAEQFRDLDLWWEVQSNLGTSSQVVPSVLMTNLTTTFMWRNPCFEHAHDISRLSVLLNFLEILHRYPKMVLFWKEISFYEYNLSFAFGGIKVVEFQRTDSDSVGNWIVILVFGVFKCEIQITDFDVPFVQDVWKLFFGV